mmetsp:Transcript_65108/g.173599  ORF Transcript_65108/g.173599 Transcript_65108/m.173599 type:complete len:148 (-) Transcript_65108:22-465(-)
MSNRSSSGFSAGSLGCAAADDGDEPEPLQGWRLRPGLLALSGDDPSTVSGTVMLDIVERLVPASVETASNEEPEKDWTSKPSLELFRDALVLLDADRSRDGREWTEEDGLERPEDPGALDGASSCMLASSGPPPSLGLAESEPAVPW